MSKCVAKRVIGSTDDTPEMFWLAVQERVWRTFCSLELTIAVRFSSVVPVWRRCPKAWNVCTLRPTCAKGMLAASKGAHLQGVKTVSAVEIYTSAIPSEG